MVAVDFNNKRSGCYLGESAALNIINEEIVIASGEGKLNAGTVLGRVDIGGAVAAAKASGNTGNGAITMDATTPVLAGAKQGVYAIRLVAAASNGGTFRVEDPDGNVLGDVAVGATFSDDIKFAIADGATDFVVGDGFDVTVAAGSKKFRAHDPAAKDGSQTPAGILFHTVDATSADVKTVATRRGPATINGNMLTLKTGISDADKAAALDALRARGLAVLPQHAA
jgi:hypothetical protein